mmetsp:Transcript_8605/g.28694  ORF Transcript_8605/g.28694 Transcript_8605/m.28694 type:complete len:369 (-) Transcript_8605:6876-7982(-)
MKLSPSVWKELLPSVEPPGRRRDASQSSSERACHETQGAGMCARGQRTSRRRGEWISMLREDGRGGLSVSNTWRRASAVLYSLAIIVACQPCGCTEMMGDFASGFPRAPTSERCVHSQYPPSYWPPSGNNHFSFQPPPEQGSLAHILMPEHQSSSTSPTSPSAFPPDFDPSLYNMPQFQQFGMPGCDDTPGNGYDSFVQDMNDPGSHNLQGNSIPDLGGNGFTGSAIGGNLGNPLEYGHDNVDERWTLISKLEALRHRGRYPQRSRTGEEDVSRDLNSKFPTDATQMTVYNRCPVQQAGMQTSHTQNDDIRKNDFFRRPLQPKSACSIRTFRYHSLNRIRRKFERISTILPITARRTTIQHRIPCWCA